METCLNTILQSLVSFLVTPDKEWSLCTFPFLVSFVLFYAVYIAIARSRRAATLAYVVTFSLFFAWKSNGILMLLLPATALFSWWATRRMMSKKHWRRLRLALIIIVDLAPLVYFKYTNFLTSIFNDIVHSNFGPFEIFLPVGISFYTFQAVSYSIDVYKGKYPTGTPLLDYLFYLTFFPLLMAGPITRAEVLLPQARHGVSGSQPGLAYHGLWLVMVGLVKKGLIADYIADYNNWIFDDPTAYSGFEDLMGVLGYTLQIYCDFSGYSDMAIGLAALMGYRLRDNFNFPYQSLNPQEFWRRWHIALSTWFRDYLYIPLGGNRHGLLRTYFNNFFTMLVAGLWHGASFMFLLWGAIHGIALVLHKICRRLFLDRIPSTVPVKIVSWTMMFTFVCVSWIFFRARDIDTALTLISHIGSDFSLDYFMPFLKARPMWLAFVLLGLELHSIRSDDYHWLEQKFVGSPWLFKLLAYAVVIQLVISFRQDNVQPFIYTQF